jgi:hypothetical protein
MICSGWDTSSTLASMVSAGFSRTASSDSTPLRPEVESAAPVVRASSHSRAGACSRTATSGSAVVSVQTTPRHPELRSRNASFSPRVRGSIGTKTHPAIEAAITASTNSGWLRIMIAKRSPGCMPFSISSAAIRFEWTCRSA